MHCNRAENNSDYIISILINNKIGKSIDNNDYSNVMYPSCVFCGKSCDELGMDECKFCEIGKSLICIDCLGDLKQALDIQ